MDSSTILCGFDDLDTWFKDWRAKQARIKQNDTVYQETEVHHQDDFWILENYHSVLQRLVVQVGSFNALIKSSCFIHDHWRKFFNRLTQLLQLRVDSEYGFHINYHLWKIHHYQGQVPWRLLEDDQLLTVIAADFEVFQEVLRERPEFTLQSYPVMISRGLCTLVPERLMLLKTLPNGEMIAAQVLVALKASPSLMYTHLSFLLTHSASSTIATALPLHQGEQPTHPPSTSSTLPRWSDYRTATFHTSTLRGLS